MKNIYLLVLFIVLTGCADEPEMTVQYLQENPSVLEEQQHRCEKLTTKKAIQDPICHMVSKAKKKSRQSDNYPKRGERTSNPNVYQQLPGLAQPGGK